MSRLCLCVLMGVYGNQEAVLLLLHTKEFHLPAHLPLTLPHYIRMALAPLPSILNLITTKVKLAFTFLWWEKIGKEDLLSWAPRTALHDSQKTDLRTLWGPSR